MSFGLNKHTSFFIVRNGGTSVKKFSIANYLLLFACICLIFTVTISGHSYYQYTQLKNSHLQSDSLSQNLSEQKDIIINQNKQIESFAFQINELKKQLKNLNEFEHKIRLIANLEKDKENDHIFGVGGSVPEDIDPRISLEKSHEGISKDIHIMLNGLNDASVIQNDNFEQLVDYLNDQKNLLASTPAINPIDSDGYISSAFGYRTSPFTGKKEFHSGLDIATRKGSPVYATADGMIAYAKKKGLLGNLVTINHGHGIISRYGHLDKILVKRGEKVKRGDTIALVGNTGRSTGPHVHYEVRLNKVPVNPYNYILN